MKLTQANLGSVSQSMGAQIGALVLATSGAQLAVGFLGTFISLRVPLENFTATMSALVLSGYFGGYTIGAVCCARIIERVGHIRAYAALAGLAVMATAIMPLAVNGPGWLLLRAVVGFGCAGLFITTEGWLIAKAAPLERGRVLSIYRVGMFIALAVGQVLISQIEIDVLDTGPGFSAEAEGAQFRPFATTKKDGTGLGLWISRSLLERYGGDLRARNRTDGVAGATCDTTLEP